MDQRPRSVPDEVLSLHSSLSGIPPDYAQPDQDFTGVSELSRVLVVTGSPDLRAALREVLDRMNARMIQSDNWRSAIKHLCFDRIPLIIYEASFRDEGWKEILSHAAMMVSPPLLVVTAKDITASFCAEVLNMGGHDVLAQPLNLDEVRHVVDSALDHWHSSSDRCTYHQHSHATAGA